MSKFLIKGPNKLKGEITVKGAKNSALKIIPASILSSDEIKITNLPKIEDVDKAMELLSDLGANIDKKESQAKISTDTIKKTDINPKLANKFRASIMFVGPLLARFKEVSFPHPGGCVIGAGGRPIDLFIEGFKAFGAQIEQSDGLYRLKTEGLKACRHFFPLISVTATETFMMTAVLAEGTTILENCAMEPEIKALADYLNSCGAQIEEAGTPNITIKGVKRITAKDFRVIPDRIETGSFAILAAMTKSELKITDCEPEHVKALLVAFDKIGIKFETGKDYIKIFKNKKLIANSIKTHEYPGFPTDLQSPYTVLMTQAEGISIIHETIYDRRLLFVDMLSQMGANIVMCDPHRVVINGPSKLYGKKLTSPDLRAGIAMIIAALSAEGTTEIDNIYQIDRGYENIDERLATIGANIKRI
ncbi:UDP-N-acetylglucosamine 1-carboxyvinyltransferase [Candidatus Parcubacteria bacterium]|nr:MAG: UDP-N-acetylglucosamine 1-carboxyvinyltransferase [Candidatus Parcubacteria bacterium]